MKKIITGVLLSFITVQGICESSDTLSSTSNRWQKSSDVVIDTQSDLMWQDNAESGFIRDTWQSAATYCETLNVGGYHDWRLPVFKELIAIVDYDRYSPAIAPSFQHSGSDYYWVSSQYGAETDSAWVVRFLDGSTRKSYKSYVNYIRCVRNK